MIDGYFLYKLTEELNQELAKARLEKIIQQDAQSFVFSFYHQRERKQLVIDLSAEHFRMHLTKHMIKETQSSQFVTTLKKQLEGSIVEKITQHQTDRVIEIHLISYDLIDGPIPKILIFEAMGRHSNLILVKDGLIIDTFKKMFFESGRQLLPQAQFSYFPTDKKSALSIQYDGINSPQDLVNTYMGISPLLAKYLDEHHLQWQDLPLKPTRNLKTNRFYAFDVFSDQDDKKIYDSLSLLLDDDTKKEKPAYLSQKQFIDKQLKKYEHKKQQLEKLLDDTKDQLEVKQLGDLIYASGHDLSKSMSHLAYDGHAYLLDPTKSLNDNAQDAYRTYQKAKRGINHITEQISINQELIELFKSFDIFISMSTQDSIKDLEQELIQYGYKKAKPDKIKKKKDKPNLLILRDNEVTYIIGKNNLQNEYITHTLAQKDDYWFHVKDAPGAHVLVQTTKLNEHILRKACMLAAYFSGQRHSSSIPVDYTLIKHIKKIPGVPGYKVTYKNQQTMYIDIDEEKIGSYLK